VVCARFLWQRRAQVGFLKTSSRHRMFDSQSHGCVLRWWLSIRGRRIVPEFSAKGVTEKPVCYGVHAQPWRNQDGQVLVTNCGSSARISLALASGRLPVSSRSETECGGSDTAPCRSIMWALSAFKTVSWPGSLGSALVTFTDASMAFSVLDEWLGRQRYCL